MGEAACRRQRHKTFFTERSRPAGEPRWFDGVHVCVSDLELGHVLLFPIDDKESRMDGQDQVSVISES